MNGERHRRRRFPRVRSALAARRERRRPQLLARVSDLGTAAQASIPGLYAWAVTVAPAAWKSGERLRQSARRSRRRRPLRRPRALDTPYRAGRARRRRSGASRSRAPSSWAWSLRPRSRRSNSKRRAASPECSAGPSSPSPAPRPPSARDAAGDGASSRVPRSALERACRTATRSSWPWAPLLACSLQAIGWQASSPSAPSSSASSASPAASPSSVRPPTIALARHARRLVAPRIGSSREALPGSSSSPSSPSPRIAIQFFLK